MALPTSALPSPTLNFKANAFASGSWSQVHGRLLLPSRFQGSPSCSGEKSSAHYGESDKVRKQLVFISERVREGVPKSLRYFLWREAEILLLERLISLAKTAFKWSFGAWFAIGFLSDVLTSIATDQEIMLPLGLFIGCVASDFLKETANEMLPDPEGKGLNWQFFGISCFFVLVKFISAFFGLKARMFLQQFGNGGILQLLWLFRGTLWPENGTVRQNHSPGQSTPITKDASGIHPE